MPGSARPGLIPFSPLAQLPRMVLRGPTGTRSRTCKPRWTRHFEITDTRQRPQGLFQREQSACQGQRPYVDLVAIARDPASPENGQLVAHRWHTGSLEEAGWRRLRSVESAISRRDLSCDEPRAHHRALGCPSGASQTSNGEVCASPPIRPIDSLAH